MKRTITGLIIATASVHGTFIYSSTHAADESIGTLEILAELTDSVTPYPPMLLSAGGDEDMSIFPEVIPPSPQAAALARYAEYPVSHTTGIPDISIPLYDIRMGDFVLPISISYHSSGARTEEIPTCVGLGWSLNAGGAISRTILGGPDIESNDAEHGDYSYFDIGNVKNLINKIKNNQCNGHLSELTNPQHPRDSESDRYVLNAGGHTGIFRYSPHDKEYVCLDGPAYSMYSYGQKDNSYFCVLCPDNTVYEFNVHEKTGVDPDETDPYFTTSWYVNKISTPYGDVTFNYLATSDRFYVKHSGHIYRSGYYPRVEQVMQNVSWYLYYEFDVKGTELKGYNMYYDQKHVSSIEWDGNKIEFDYSPRTQDELNIRLLRMRVITNKGDTLKTVDFGNDVKWRSNNSKGRRMLTSLRDSQMGTYSFTYNTDKPMTYMVEEGDPSTCTDSWGYYNGSSGWELSKDLSVWLSYDENDSIRTARNNWILTHWRDRGPKLEYTKLGTLKMISYPTGGCVTYNYELNELDGIKYGGLRVASTEVFDGQTKVVKKYLYNSGVQTQMHPDSLSKYISYLRIDNSYTPANPITRKYRTVMSSPAYSVFTKSAPVLYTAVTEVLSDGSYTEYEYDALKNRVDPTRKDWNHPSTFAEALVDRGLYSTVLISKKVYSSDKMLQFREINTYSSQVSRSIGTGVRIKSVIDWYIYNGGEDGYVRNEDEFMYGVSDNELLVRETTAEQIATVLRSTLTEDLTTGVSNCVSYDYDSQYRTLKPTGTTVANSDGNILETRYEYPFHRSGTLYTDMMENGYNYIVLSESHYSSGSLISKKEMEYDFSGSGNGDSYSFLMPFALSSWSYPTTANPDDAGLSLVERKRVSSYNEKGHPLSIKVNDTDVTSFTWDQTGTLLSSSTAPGGLVTKYTHRPLFGLASVTQPNGLKTTYSYNEAGLLGSVSDNGGLLQRYSYSIANHPTASMTGSGNSVTTERSLHYAGSITVKTRQYHDGLGRPATTVQGGMNTKETYIYTAVSYDALGRESLTVLPSVGGSTLSDKTFAQVKALSSSTYSGDQYAWSETTYDALGRPVKATTPGNAWHSAGKGKTTQYISNASNSVRLYKAPMTSITLVEDGYYPAKTLQGVRTVDEDGKEMTVYTDKLGRKVLERRGPESQKGMNDTYFVYNELGQLRYVLSPGYELSGFKDMFAYEYRYDQHGNVVKKFIPGAGYTQYWYDRAGRLSFMQDPNLREKGQHRFYIHDKAGRLVIQGVSKSCNRSQTVNFADYTGGNTGFMSTGYTLTDASRIQQVTLEAVSYYDTYSFASTLDKDLVKSNPMSAKGLQTGSVVYSSDGTKSVSAVYYDIRGNVTECMERTPFGSLRTTANTYTYSGQPLKSTVTEGSVRTITENTYDSATGLLTDTHVTVNNTRQRVSAVTYDELGRIESVTRGADSKSGGTVTYRYNLHGQTTEIKGPGLTQNLYYADWNGNKLYNGSVSAMTWKMGTDETIRGYRYSYNGYSWLTSADYGEGSSLTDHKDRYSERSLDFMRNGGIRRLQRHGLKADGVYGKVDNLHISYVGNRIGTVLEDAEAVTQNGSMDYPGTNREMHFAYNDWGAMVSDESRGIIDISYDRFGNPLRISFSQGVSTENVYSSTGEKLRATHYTSLNGIVRGKSTTEYHGNVIYRDGKVDMVLFPGGYATVNGTTVTFHYYTQDYLGNNRAVINGSTGAIEQTIAYYPYGAVIADLGTPTTGQPYKFGGKELITANGLNEYDFGARQYYSAVPHFTRIDPLCEKYFWLSPYLYCANNPINAIDPDGRDVFLYATTLPDGPDYGKLYRKYGPTHTFITVVQGETTHYFAYGSEIDGIEGATKGHLKQRYYRQDREVYTSNGENKNLKARIKIDPPEGVSSDDFDKAVIDVANLYGDQEGINYHFATSSDITGNCNSSTSTILFKAGISKEKLSEIRSKIPGMDWGFGDIKPWTDTEQINALKNICEGFTRMLYYEKLEEALH